MNLWRQISLHLPRPVCVAGYSLGEMAACCASGAFTPEEGILLCAKRAECMDACVSIPSGLLAVLGLPLETTQEIARLTGTVIAIRNAPDHIVLGGTAEALRQSALLAEARGAAHVLRLGVTTPSHTSFLKDASTRFATHLLPYREGKLSFPVLSANSGRPAWTAAAALDALTNQISIPMNWDLCLSTLGEMQPDRILEIGPGNSLARMWSARNSRIPARATDDFRTHQGILDWLTPKT